MAYGETAETMKNQPYKNNITKKLFKIAPINTIVEFAKIVDFLTSQKKDFSDATIQELIEAYNNMELGYVEKIETYCWFYNTGEVAGKDDKVEGGSYEYYRYKLNTGKDAHYYRGSVSEIKIDKLSLDSKKISSLYNDLLTYSKGYSTKNFDLYNYIREELISFLGDINLKSIKKSKNSYLKYDDLKKANETINSLYNEIDKFSSSGLKSNIISRAQDIKFRINTDIEWVADTSYGYDVVDTEQKKVAKEAVIAAFTYNTSWAEFVIPSTSQMISFIQNRFPKVKFDNKKLIIGMDYAFGDKGVVKCLGNKVDRLKDELGKLKNKINNIYDAYESLEKSAKDKFEGKKTHKKYSKTEIAKKYATLVSVAGPKAAKKYLEKILKDTKSKVTKKQVLSLYKKYKKDGKVSGTLFKKKKETKDDKKHQNNKEPKGNGGSSGNGGSGNSGGSGGGALAATGAKVAKTKKKKSKSKKKNKVTAGNTIGVMSAAKMAAYERDMNKKFGTIDKIKAGTTNKIEQAKLDLNTKISQINSDRDANIANIESERDSNIADLYEQASNEINSIDPTDSDAKEQIASIKSDLENNINQVNEDANAQIEEVKANAEQQIAEANEEASTEIENIQKGSDKEINTIMENGLDNETTTGQDLETAADTAPTAKEVDQTNINDANGNKEQSASSLEKSRTEYNNNVSAKEQEINNPSSNQTEIESTGSEESSSSEETMVYQQESNNSSSDESSNYSNYSSNEYNESNNSSTASSDPGDVYVDEPETEIVETPAVPEEELGAETTVVPDNPNNEELTETGTEVGNSNSEIIDVPKKENKSNVAIPIGLGVAAAGAAAVAGVRFVKNRKQNDESEESYDDENNNLDDYESGSDDSEYMKDDYLGPSGSMYTDTDFEDDELSEVPDDTKYNDAAHLEEQIEDDSDAFTEDEILNDLG